MALKQGQRQVNVHIFLLLQLKHFTFLNRTDLEEAELLQLMAKTGTSSKTRSRASPEHPNGKCINQIFCILNPKCYACTFNVLSTNIHAYNFDYHPSGIYSHIHLAESMSRAGRQFVLQYFPHVQGDNCNVSLLNARQNRSLA